MNDAPPAIATGTEIGPYKVLGWLGAGGMGDVYRAHDPRLAREVALKVIRHTAATDASRVRRFEREARAAGQINHPNILAVYDTGVHEGAPYIVSELLEGESLHGRLHAGPLPWRKAIDYARQMAEGLGAAHDKGIVHRDLKPGNLFLTSDGRIKILDFGIAKLNHASGDVPGQEQGVPETEAHVVIGTAAYMSPEQVRGEDVDGRSDIFSAGATLYEWLYGREAFARDSRAETVAAILKEDPLQQATPTATTVPPALERIVARCLEKSREARFQSARDLAFALETLPATALMGVSPPVRRVAPWLLAGALAAGLTLAAMLSMPRQRATLSPPLRLTAELSPGVSLGPINAQFGEAAVLSSDGTTIAFVAREGADARRQIYIRRLDQLRAEPLPGTDDAMLPFFSPDGRWIGFFAGQKLLKIAVTGGAAVMLADAPQMRGGSWSDDDSIVFSPDSAAGTRLQRVAASGGSAQPVAVLDEGERAQHWPQVLPGGKTVLYTSSRPGGFNNAELAVQSLTGGSRKVIMRGGYHGRYVHSGHVVYIHDGTLFAVPFDITRLEVTGPPVAAIEGMRSNSITGGAQFSVSATGTLMYLPGPSIGAGIPMQWMDAQAKATPLRTVLANWGNVSFSPDGRRLAMEIRDAPAGIWVLELAQDRMTRLTSDRSENVKPVWSPDGLTIAFASTRANASAGNLYWLSADGGGEPRRLTDSPNIQRAGSWHPGGRFLAFDEATSRTNSDIMMLPLDRDEGGAWKAGTPQGLVNTAAQENEPAFSPDGRWLAYASDESGRLEVYVRPFPGPGGKTRVSIEGGFTPTWSRTSAELFYGFFDGRIMVTPYTVTGQTFAAGTPRTWSEGRYQTRGGSRMFDLHPDGVRFALAPVTESPTAARLDTVVLVFNFFDELRRLAAAKP